ncbi:MAG: hypothetical protein NVSMB9_34920 [Isosphaeraceae bacterium]
MSTSTQRSGRLWTLVILALAVAAGVTAFVRWRGKGSAETAAQASVAIDEKASLGTLARALRDSDARALAVLSQRTVKARAGSNEPLREPLSESEGREWVEVLKGIRTGFGKFGSHGRSTAITVVGRTVEKFAVEPAPQSWIDAMSPAQDLLSAGLVDTHVDVKTSALIEIGQLWCWLPGRTLLPREEETVVAWKEGFTTKVIRSLGDREPKVRAAAIACLGHLPDSNLAGAAVAYLEDPASPEVRKQVLVSFAQRPDLLTDDALLRHVDDPDAGLAEVSNLILRTRGLNQEQISLGRMIFHAKPEIRASVIPLLKDRTDIDPIVWLLQLSRDTEESVRIGSIDALASRLTPEVGQRLAEMATTDKSQAVRRAASKHLPESEKTAALPPLPSSTRIYPKAN